MCTVGLPKFAQSSVRDTRPEDFVTQSLGCGGFSWFGEALCIVKSAKTCGKGEALCIVKSAKTCGKLCVLDVAQSSVRGTCPRGILQHRAWVAGFLPGLAKLCVLWGCVLWGCVLWGCVLWGCPNLNGALCFVEPAGIFRKLCAFCCS